MCFCGFGQHWVYHCFHYSSTNGQRLETKRPCWRLPGTGVLQTSSLSQSAVTEQGSGFQNRQAHFYNWPEEDNRAACWWSKKRESCLLTLTSPSCDIWKALHAIPHCLHFSVCAGLWSNFRTPQNTTRPLTGWWHNQAWGFTSIPTCTVCFKEASSQQAYRSKLLCQTGVWKHQAL